MKENIITTQKKISDLKVTKEEIPFLSHQCEFLVPNKTYTSEDRVSFEFQAEGLFRCSDILKTTKDKYRFLANCADLKNLNEEFDFSMHPENIMCDINLIPKILLRDKIGQLTDVKKLFLDRYKALAGCILNSKYSYDSYYQGGNDLFQKNLDLGTIADCDDVEKIKTFFLNQYNHLCKLEEKTKVAVSKKKVIFCKIIIPILVLFMLGLGAAASMAYIVQIPFKDTILSADNYYLAGNYVEVQTVLSNISVDDLPISQKFILSRSYIISEGMTQEQKTNILNGITFNTNELVMNYWIYVGRLDFDNAIDAAQKIGDDELLLYAYMKQRAVIQENNSLSGEEKTNKLKELEEKITSITDAITSQSTNSTVVTE